MSFSFAKLVSYSSHKARHPTFQQLRRNVEKLQYRKFELSVSSPQSGLMEHLWAFIVQFYEGGHGYGSFGYSKIAKKNGKN